MILQYLIAGFTALTALAAWVSARAASVSAAKAGTALRATLVSDLLRYRASKEMLDAMNALVAWKKKLEEKNWAYIAVNSRFRDDEAGELDVHRRYFTRYFDTIHRFKLLGFVEDDDIQMLVGPGELQVLLEIVEPIEKELTRVVSPGVPKRANRDLAAEMFGYFRAIYEEYEDAGSQT